jgi:hypothetical protein
LEGSARDEVEDGHGDPPPPGRRINVMTGERELTAVLLSNETNSRPTVSGPVGVKQIKRLIAKLKLDKEILAKGGDAEGVGE